jgi:hypothetical protein
VGLVGTGRRDATQERREARKRRADKFEELVAALYESDHWADSSRQRDAVGDSNVPETVSPFAKVQSIWSVYFPQFDEGIRELDIATLQYRMWIHAAAAHRISNNKSQFLDGFSEAHAPYVRSVMHC